MLVDPDAGWVRVKIGEFEDRASYLTDVPIDILEALVRLYRERNPVAVRFDAEGWDYVIVFDHYAVYIIDYQIAP